MVRILGKKHAPADAKGDVPAVIKADRTKPGAMGGVNAKAKKRQGLILGAAGLVMIGAACAYIFPGGDSGSKKVAVDASAPYAPQISVPDMVNKNLSQREWIAASGNRLQGIENRLKPVENQGQEVADLNKKLSDLQVQTQANNANYLHTLQAYETENRKLVDQAAQGSGKGGVASGPGGPAVGVGPSGEPFRVAGANGSRPPIYGQAGGYDANGRPVGGPAGGTVGAADPATGMGGSELKTISFGGAQGVSTGSASEAASKDNVGLHVMRPDAPPTIVEDAPDYLPPNSYAPARVIVGVDASAGVASQNDPLPVVLRITGPARSVVNHGHVLTTRLEGCVVNGAARGDLSAEKIYVKLAKMTCDQPGGRVAVSEVKGFISFGGKTGVRGRVVTREGGLIGQAFLAGIAGGFGRAFTANNESLLNGSQNITVGGARQMLGPGAIAAGGLGEGVSKSADMVSKYLIERAEQYQPVIEMPTGIDVEIVFLDGVYVRAGR